MATHDHEKAMPRPARVLVCGGRAFDNFALLERIIDEIAPIVVIEGGNSFWVDAAPECNSRRQKIQVAYPQRLCEFVQRHNGRVSPAVFQPTQILLRKAGKLGQLLLRQPSLEPNACEISADELAHVHPVAIAIDGVSRYQL